MEAPRSNLGRPSRADAAARREKFLKIAAEMFMENGFDGTSMDRLAELAGIGKATLYARYADKASLFADVLRRRIIEVFEPLEATLHSGRDREDLAAALTHVGRQLLENSLAPSSVSLGRILAAQGPRFPDIANLAVREGWERQIDLVQTILDRFSRREQLVLSDTRLAADLFLSLVLGRASRCAVLGVPVQTDAIGRRVDEAVGLFVRGVVHAVPEPADHSAAARSGAA